MTAMSNVLVKHVHDVAKAERADRRIEVARQRKLRTVVDAVGVQQVLVMLATIMEEDEAHIDRALMAGSKGGG